MKQAKVPWPMKNWMETVRKFMMYPETEIIQQ